MIKKLINQIGFSWIFFALVMLIYIVIAFVNNNIFLKSLKGTISQLVEIIPVLLLIFIFTFFANLLLDSKAGKKFLTKQSGFVGYLLAIIFGIISTGPIYVWYPLLSELKEDGLNNSLIAVFLYNRAIKIALIPVIIYYFGLSFLVVTTLLMIIFSIINGYFISLFVKN